MIRDLRQRIRANWNATDTLITVTNTCAFAVFIWNCSLRSVEVCLAASIVPLLVQSLWAWRRPGFIREALCFGALVAIAWPIGEGLTALLVGWWGKYLAPGPAIWHTPLYCSFIGWLASTHLYYFSKRALEFGFGLRVAVANTMLTAFSIGIIGESLFVIAGMWEYRESILDFWRVPAFVPTGYAIGYGVLPLLRNYSLLKATLIWGLTLGVACIGLGVVTGYY